jgi:outer membrane immunogenic protein
MRFHKHGAAVAAALAISSILALGTASAADLPSAEVMPGAAPVVNWTGFYVGIHGGGAWADSQSTFVGGGASPADFALSGPFIGAQIGYNWQSSNMVWGIEADTSWSGINGERVTSGPGGTTTQHVNWLSTARLRLGWLNSTNMMPYITGGLAFAQGSRTNSIVAETVSASHTGWTIGGGIEWALASSWTAKAEYKYIDLGAGTYNFSSNPSNVDINLHTFEIGLNKHF